MRWPPEDRPRVLAKTLPGLQQVFMDIVSELPHHDRDVYRIATGNATSSPFTPQQVKRARDALAASLELPPEEAAFVASNRPFHLRLLSATLFTIGDPDWRQAVESSWSFERGVPIGVGIKMPRVPAVYERKLTWRSLDDTAFEPDRDNYKSAQAVIDTLVGHEISGSVGAKVYTHRTPRTLSEAIEVLRHPSLAHALHKVYGAPKALEAAAAKRRASSRA